MIYISHSTLDVVIANEICQYLENNNIKCWISHRDILENENWDEEVASALETAKIFLLIFSKNAIKSEQVKIEVGFVYTLKIPILLFSIGISKDLTINDEDAVEDFEGITPASYRRLGGAEKTYVEDYGGSFGNVMVIWDPTSYYQSWAGWYDSFSAQERHCC